MQDCSNSSALAMELLQSCTKPSIYTLLQVQSNSVHRGQPRLPQQQMNVVKHQDWPSRRDHSTGLSGQRSTGVRCCFWLNLSSDLTLYKSCLNFWLKSEIRLKSETAPHPWCLSRTRRLSEKIDSGNPGYFFYDHRLTVSLIFKFEMWLVSLWPNNYFK